MTINKSTKLHFIKTLSLVAFVISFFAFYQIAEAATLSVSPSTGVYTVGTPFSVTISLNTSGKAVNAAEGLIKFNPNELRVQSLSQAGSVFNLWAVEPVFSNSAGTITFGGGSPRGYTGSNGTIITVRFIAQGAGTTKVNFSSGSALAADGSGTNILTSMGSGSFTIAAKSATPEPEQIEYIAPANTPSAPVIVSGTHPDPAGWSTSAKADLKWNLPSGITAVRTGLNNSPNSVPTVVYDPPISSKAIEGLEQGVQYFHVQFRNENGWGKVASYRLAVDSERPSKFDISLIDSTEGGNTEPTLKFDVVDATSDVRRFIIQIDGGEAIEYLDETGSSTYKLPRLEPGRHSVVVEAFDEAGNSIVSQFAFDIASFEKPIFTDYPSRLSTGVVPVITGSTRPRSEVHISVTRINSSVSPTEYTVKSDDSGKFTFIPDGAFDEGIIELVAYSVDEYGAQSENSDTVRIVVAPPGYIQFGSMLVSALSLFVPLVALLLLLILATLYLVRRIRGIGTYVVKETKEAESMVVSSFAKIRNTLDTHVKTLASSRKTKQLTKAESDLIEAMRQELQAAERRVKKEVSDVDDIV
jgi:hypothetical protein